MLTNKLRHSLVLLACMAFGSVLAQTTPTVTLAINPTSAISPATATLTWSSTGAATCTASGSWSGTKATSGSQALTNLTADATYTLTCKAADLLGSATLTWNPPTQNTDGTALTNLAGYRILHGTSATSLTTTINVANPSVSTYIVEDLPAGPRAFAVKAYNSAGGESANSNVATKTIVTTVGGSASKSVTFTAIKVPNAPTGLLVADATAYKFDNGNRDQSKLVRIGTVPMNWPCVGQPRNCVYDPAPLCVNIVALGARRADLVKLNTGTSIPMQVWAQCSPLGG